MTLRCILRSSVLTLGLLASGCVTTGGDVADIQPGEKPDITTDEAGLWMVMGGSDSR